MAAIISICAGTSAWAASGQPNPDDPRIPNHYIVVLKDSVDHPGVVAEAQTESRDGDLGFVYRSAIKGYSASDLFETDVESLREDPRVKYVIADREGTVQNQSVPNGLKRIFAPNLLSLDIDEVDDVRVDADVAVIDTGIDYTHPDLNVAGRADCTVEAEQCLAEQGIDTYSHGTHVGGTIGAIDNGIGVVGVAPGARLWGLKVGPGPGVDLSSTLAAIEWVTGHATQIEVVNMSIAFGGYLTAMEEAIEKSVKAGVVYVVAAGNKNENATNFSPAGLPNVITVSALSDYDGLPGHLGKEVKCVGGTSNYGPDDEIASYSNWGPAVDLIAPGSCINSTWIGGTYREAAGTSMASPHVAGAAAILASEANPSSKADVEAIKGQLVEEGSLDWIDNSEDGQHEPLLDLRPPARDAVTLPASGLQPHSAVLSGIANPGGEAATFRFEFGTTSEYGQSVPAAPQGIGSGVSDVEVAKQIATEPETVYHYRLVVSTGSGTSYGQDRTVKTSRWELRSPALPDGYGDQFRDVSCTSATDCIAVGDAGSEPLSERWDGTSWTRLTTPRPEASGAANLEQVSCASATSCVATGTGPKSVVFSLIWDGSKWTLATPVMPAGASGQIRFEDIECETSTYCVAVGSYSIASPNRTALAELWNGKEWSVQPTPEVEGKKSNSLTGVSCSSTVSCLAVGTSKKAWNEGEVGPLVEGWNGSSWSVKSSPSLPGPPGSLRVSCRSASFCMASGASTGGGFTSSWNGTSWTLESSGVGSIEDISCGSTSSCDVISAKFGQHWNGAGWQEQLPALPDGDQPSLEAISCVGPGICVAVGFAYQSRHGDLPVAEILTPTWAQAPEAALPKAPELHLNKISCASATYCMAISSGFASLWDGTKWKEKGRSSRTIFQGVSCPITSFCLGVGATAGGGISAETWNGTYWTNSSFVIPAGDSHQAPSVSCVSASSCIAVGTYWTEGKGYLPMAQYWDGTKWALQSPPAPSGSEGQFKDVSCSSSTNCIAVGTAGSNPLSERWDGTKWSLLTTPRPEGSGSVALEQVSCASATSCVATGTGPQSGVPFSMSWDGSKWTLATPAVPAGALGSIAFGDLTCQSPTYCIAAGSYVTERNPPLYVASKIHTLVELWNGKEWSVQPTPEIEGKKINTLTGVSCSSTVSCLAVGTSRKAWNEGDYEPLVEGWNGSSWSVVTALPKAPELHLNKISCASATYCMAISSGFASLWDGTKWKEKGRSSRTIFQGVSCPITSFCLGVGATAGGGISAETWNGTYWTNSSFVIPAGDSHQAPSVSCVSASSCIAVGTYWTEGKGYLPMAQYWDGTKWALQSPPAPSGSEGQFKDVSCSSSTNCIAVGTAGSNPLSERWDGTKWSLLTTPRPEGSGSVALEQVSCASATSCVATGTGPQSGVPFSMSWDGSKWTLATPAVPAGALGSIAFGDLTCQSPTYCIAAGSYVTERNPPLYVASKIHTLVELWNGKEWSVQPTPEIEGKKINTLTGVSCSSTVSCLAVGTSRKAWNEGDYEPLVEAFTQH